VPYRVALVPFRIVPCLTREHDFITLFTDQIADPEFNSRSYILMDVKKIHSYAIFFVLFSFVALSSRPIPPSSSLSPPLPPSRISVLYIAQF
jgi:hypothetical protein